MTDASPPPAPSSVATTDASRPGPAPMLNLPGPPGTPPHHRRRHRIWPWVLVGLLLIAGGGVGLVLKHRHAEEAGGASGAGAAGAGKGPGQGPATITVGSSQRGDIKVYVHALGTITPISTVTVYSLVTGQVTKVYFHEGQIVTKGQPLIDIDPRPFQANLLQAQGTLQHDTALLAEARMDLQRYRTAYASGGAVAKQQLDDQEQLVVQDEGSVKADQGTVNYDQVELSYCSITAPETGRIGLRLVDSGNVVFSGSNTTLAVITQLQPITVVFSVAEDDLPEIMEQLQPTRKLSVDAFDRSDEHRLESGQLTALDNEVDTTTGTVKFRAELPNAKLRLYPNQFVNARLLVKTLTQVVLLPSAAVQHNGPDAFVYVIDGGKATVKPVTVLTSDDQHTAVEGVDAGVQVATSAFDRLENGVAVTIKAPDQGGDKSGAKRPDAGSDVSAKAAAGTGAASSGGSAPASPDASASQDQGSAARQGGDQQGGGKDQAAAKSSSP